MGGGLERWVGGAGSMRLQGGEFNDGDCVVKWEVQRQWVGIITGGWIVK